MDPADLGLGDGTFAPYPGLAATLAHGMDFFDRPSGVVIPQFASSLSASLGGQSSDGTQNPQASADQGNAALPPVTSSRDYDRFSDPVASASPAASAYDQFSDAVASAPRSVGGLFSDAVPSSEVGRGATNDFPDTTSSDGAPRSVGASDGVASAQVGASAQGDPVWDPFGEVAASAPAGQAIGSFVDQAKVALRPSFKDFRNYLSESGDALAQGVREISGYARDLVDNPVEFLRQAGPTFAGLGFSIPTVGVGTSTGAAALRGGPAAAEEISTLAAPSTVPLSRGLIGAEETAAGSAAAEGTETAGSLAPGSSSEKGLAAAQSEGGEAANALAVSDAAQPATAATEEELAAGESAASNTDPAAAWRALSRSEKRAIKERLRLMFNNSKEVIYDFVSDGVRYVGQTSRGFQRMVEHLYKGKLHPDDIGSIFFKETPGGQLAREMAERDRIEQLGGLEKTANKKLPVSDARLSRISPPALSP